MRTSGWLRIGIVLAVLYGAIVVAIALNDNPRLENKQNEWFSEAAGVIADVLSKTEKQVVTPNQVSGALLNDTASENAAWLEKVATSPSENQKKFSTQVAKVNEKHRQSISALHREQRTHWSLAFGWWVGGVSILFATGWSIGWVYRGFRLPAA